MESFSMVEPSVYEEVPIDKLRWSCPEEFIPFSTSEEVVELEDLRGQGRAVKAIELGLAVEGLGYNIFVTGLSGLDRIDVVERLLRHVAKREMAAPSDICCVHNFKDPDAPRVLWLPAGRGTQLRKDIGEFIESLKRNIPEIFESEEYKARRKSITETFRDKQKAIIKEFEKKVSAENFTIVQVQMGPFTRPGIVPVVMGNPMALEQVEALVEKGEYPRETYERLARKLTEFASEMENIFTDLQKKEKDFEEKMKSLDKELVSPLLGASVNLIRDKYDSEKLNHYLAELTEDLLANFQIFLPRRDKETQTPPSPASEMLTEYQVNVLVDNEKTDGIPIVIEKNPNYRNLFGGIEKVLDPRYGVWRSDFSRIKAGSLLRANGGYLVLNFMDAVMEPGVWHTLKRVLKNRSIEVQSFDPYYIFTMSTLKPEPIQLDIKVLLLGDNHLYYLLLNLDEDFRDIFKVKADFDTAVDNNRETVLQFVSCIKKIGKDRNLMSLDQIGMATLIEHAVRLAGRQKKISTQLSRLADILLEANYWAKSDKSSIISGRHVEKAIENRDYRANLIETKIQEMIDDGLLMIDTEGTVVGQVNGLSVYDLGDYAFGKPSRITAKTSMGRAGIINIEREAELSGKTHDKGVLILSGYLRDKYAQNKPLTMSASICFEQSYGGVDGDSASSTEIYAVLSSLANLPLRQDIAVTGSVNQKGEVQPIGGVNQKIEGFFDVCRAKGLIGTQGVMIPHQNVGDLMLRKDVVAAIKDKRFHLYPVKTIDQGIELLTGVSAGERKQKETYPEGTVNFLVDQRLQSLAEGLKAFGEEERQSPKKPARGTRSSARRS
jgi:lon-related putative ATP-dependent protease